MNEEVLLQKFQNHLDTLDLQKYSYKKKSLIIWLVTFLSLFILTIIAGLMLPMIFLGFSIALTILTLFLFLFVGASERKKIGAFNSDILKNSLPSLHQLWFNNNNLTSFKTMDLKFIGIQPSKVFAKTLSFHFTVSDELIIWNIDEDIERRTRTVRDSNGKTRTESYYVYLLKYALQANSKKHSELQDISISKKHLFGNKGAFISESIEFNKRFSVKYNDEIDVFKLFTPKIIENFNLQDKRFLDRDTISLKNETIWIKNNIRSESTSSWHPNLLDFSVVRWTEKHMTNDLKKKIEKDFVRFHTVLNLLVPLELYD